MSVPRLAGSNEFFTKAGGTNAGFVDAVYFDALGRGPTNAERTSATSDLAHESRGKFAEGVAQGTEAHTHHVSDAYMGYLGRKASPSEIAYWVGKLNSGLRSEDFDAIVVASSEYYAANS